MKRKARPIGSTVGVASSVADWCRSHHIRRCVLFGSRARGEERADSDVDLALWTVRLPAAAERLAWRRELAGVTATSYRDVFRQAASHGLVDPALARRLEDAAGMRNVLVHLYAEIDFEILHASVGQALHDFTELVATLAAFAQEPENPSADDD